MAELPEDRFYVYLHRFPDGSAYIGKGAGNRAHVFGASKRNPAWVRTKNKHGKPKVEFLAQNLTEDLAYFAEEEAVNLYRLRGEVLRNLANGGLGPLSGLTGPLSHNYGRFHSDQWKSMMSERNSGLQNPHYGYAHSEESKAMIGQNTKLSWQNNYEKMRSINKGRKLTDEHKEKIGAASKMMPKETRDLIREKLKGKKRTPEQRARISAGSMGKKMPDEAKKKMSESQWQKDRTIHEFLGPDGEVFKGMRSEFSKKFGFSVNDLFRNDKRRRPHVKGWKLRGSN